MIMTIQELIKELTEISAIAGANTPVILASDSEENDYSTLHKKHSVHLGYDENFYRMDLTDKEFNKIHKKHIKCVILSPWAEHIASPEEAAQRS